MKDGDDTATPWPRVDAQGEALDIQIAPDAEITAAIQVHGVRNRLVLEAGVKAIPYAPAGFAATVPDPGSSGGASIVIDGHDNSVLVAAGTRLGVNLTIRGSGNHVEIGPGCHLHGFINLLGSKARLTIGAGTTMVQGSLQLHEAGEIRIGQDCMISSQVYVSLSDIHPIYDRASGRRINPPASVEIGNHVWAGLRCMVMKGARIGEGSVIAAGAIVSGEIPTHVIAAGIPAKVMRENVEWRRDFGEGDFEPTAEIVSQARKKRWGVF